MRPIFKLIWCSLLLVSQASAEPPLGNVAELAQQEFSDRLKSIQKLEATYHLDVQATPRHEDCGEFTIAGHKIVIGPSETHTTG